MNPPKTNRVNFIWSPALAILISLSLLIVLALLMGRQFDDASVRDEQTRVENGWVGRVAEASNLVVAEADWDDAVRHLDNRYDPAWARRNIGAQLSQIDGFTDSIILRGDDRPVFASHNGAEASPQAYQPLLERARSLISAVRLAEARRGPFPAQGDVSKVVSRPIQSSTVTVIHGDVVVISATLVQPDFGTAAPAARGPIILTTLPIDRAFLDEFARRYLMNDLRLRIGDSRRETQRAHAPMLDDAHRVVATLDWTPSKPGTAMLRRLAWPVLILIGVLGAVTLLLYRRGRRLAQVMIASEARVSHLAFHDALTNLPNRVLFFDRLGHALRQMQRVDQSVAVHCIDLDGFKFVNDTFGHPIGDQLIKAAGERLAAQCRPADTFARLSGDEFAIIQTDATPHGAAALAARLTRVMSEPMQIGQFKVFVGCSVGVTIVSDADTDPAEALRQADLALYRAKQTGKGRYSIFEIEMDAAVKMRRALEYDLREALANGGLTMAYQPQVNGRGEMTGVEALVRWRHPERGDISPAFFVPIAEDCGLIIDLGMFTLRRAFEDSRRWGPLKVAVNISAHQLRLADFVSNIADLVLEHDVDPRQFELEITEGVLLGDDPATQATLERLRGLGFAIALDDFGTGYSSLSYLKKYPIDKIKIDRSFVINLGVEAGGDAVVEAIIRLAQALHLAVIAEGVETHKQRDVLAAAGCSNIQGYLFSKPLPASDIDRLHARHAALPATEDA